MADDVSLGSSGYEMQGQIPQDVDRWWGGRDGCEESWVSSQYLDKPGVGLNAMLAVLHKETAFCTSALIVWL